MLSHNLPLQLTSFIGRKQESVQVRRLLQTSRLVTLTGSGGCGKTRLASHAVSFLLKNYADGVCWVELGTLTDPTNVPRAISKALGVHEQAGRAPTDLILDFLRDKRLLLVLDNCEHQLNACAPLAQALLAEAPEVSILVTSREPLTVTGEMLYPVLPLFVPPRGQIQDIGSFDAVQLFVERARAVLPSFALTTENAAAIAEICRRLDGIPLAIELASALVNVLTLQQIAVRLDDRFNLLASSPRDTASYHQTLRGTIDWSYDLLSDSERTLLRRVSVFGAGWTLDLAEAVCADGSLPQDRVLGTLVALVRKSLVEAETLQGSEARYRLLETIRQYGQEKLAQSGEAPQTRDRLLDHFARLAEATAPKLRGPYQLLWLNWIERELDNFRTAIEWSLESGHIEMGLRVVNGLSSFWRTRVYLSEAHHWFERLLERAGPDVPVVARARSAAYDAMMAGLMGETVAAQRRGREAIEFCRQAGEEGKPILALALMSMSGGARATGDYASAHDLIEESIQLFRELDNKPQLALALQVHALIAMDRSELASARHSLEEGLTLARGLEDTERMGHMLNSMGDVARLEEDYSRAHAAYEGSLALFRKVGAVRDVAAVLHNLAHTYLHEGNVARADELFRESLTMQQEKGDRHGIAECLSGLAALAITQGLPEQGARLLGASGVLGREAIAQWPVERMEYDYYLAQVRAQLPGKQFEQALSEGRTLSLEGAVKYAQGLPLGSLARKLDSRPDYGGLTPREREIAGLIARGKSNIEIADDLVLSKRTVEKHVANLLSKLAFTSRAQIVRWAIEKGLASTP